MCVLCVVCCVLCVLCVLCIIYLFPFLGIVKGELEATKILKHHQLEAELSQNFVCRVAARCLASGFWEPLLYCIRNGNVMTTLLPDFASTLVEHNQIVSTLLQYTLNMIG